MRKTQGGDKPSNNMEEIEEPELSSGSSILLGEINIFKHKRRAKMKAFRIVLAIIAISFAFASSGLGQAGKTRGSKTKIFEGSSKSLGAGKAHTFVAIDGGGKPTTLGIVLTEATLDGLTDADSEVVLNLPEQIAVPPYKHVVVNWNPSGHEPVNIYGVPHFDFHFYLIPEEERIAIIPGPDTTQVPQKFCPRGYFSYVYSMPKMGVHWVDSLAKELKGDPFTETFIYGFYHGNMIFLEPMMTKAYLETKPSYSSDLKLPGAYQCEGYYPIRYSIRSDPKTKKFTVSLEGLTLRKP